MAKKLVAFLGKHSNKTIENNRLEAVKNVPSSYAHINRVKKRHQIAFRRFMIAEAPGKELSSYLGCDRTFLREYISSKMAPGIHWNNYGSEWVIEHIVPLRLFDMFEPADLRLVWNYRNLMPLFKKDNLHKEGDLRFSIILLDKIDDGSEIVQALRRRSETEIRKMEKYLTCHSSIQRAS